MARVTCRCGEVLSVAAGDERAVCPKCGARIRVRRRPTEAAERSAPPPPPNDGFVRFPCPCGRRLKVRAVNGPKAGRCPDCGRTVPVPDAAIAALDDPETRTDELDQNDLARLRRWAARHGVSTARPASSAQPPSPPAAAEPYAPPRAAQVEAGLRVCPKCGQPLHRNAVACPSCGAYAPKT